MYSFKAMNTTINIFYLPEDIGILVESWFHYSERVFSRFMSKSELSQLNHSQGKIFVPSTILFDMLIAANRFYKETDGLFNPFLGKVISELGYNKSFEKLQSKEIEGLTSIKNVPIEPLIFDYCMRSVQLFNAFIDLGGIAKGWTAQQIAYQLQRKGEAKGAISAGGDIVVWGKMEGAWNISIANPHYLDHDLFSLKIMRDAGIATSSTQKRKWQTNNGHTNHHIIDPRSLHSSQSDLIQATVLAPDLTTAEVYAKCLIILGWEEGLKWLHDKNPELGVIGVKSDQSIVYGGAIDEYCPKGVIRNEPTIS